MSLFQYKYTHDGGMGDGSVEAENAKDAQKIVTDKLKETVTSEVKIKNLKVTVTEVEEE